jgi:hypothetical protein
LYYTITLEATTLYYTITLEVTTLYYTITLEATTLYYTITLEVTTLYNTITLEATNTKFIIFGCDPSGGLKLQSTTIEASMLTITPPMQLRV